ncbi:MAG: PEGA domain-containing protein [Bdellovibrionales bacterium]|nr:PEGA domain-containing protein [Bdellovibrionales bacterium]
MSAFGEVELATAIRRLGWTLALTAWGLAGINAVAEEPSAAVRPRLRLRSDTFVQITSKPESAEVWIAGRRWGRTPLTLRGALRPGTYPIRLTLDDHQTLEESIDVEPRTLKQYILVPKTERMVLEPGAGVRERPSDAKGAYEADYRRGSRPDAARTAQAGGYFDPDPYWMFGLLVGTGGAPLEEKPATGYLSVRASVRHVFMEFMSVEAGLELALAPSVDERPGGGEDESGSMLGFGVHVGLPFLLLDGRRQVLRIWGGPELGIINHGYRYNAPGADGFETEVAFLRVIQPKLGGSLSFQVTPLNDDDSPGERGFVFRFATNAHFPPGPDLRGIKPGMGFDFHVGFASIF